jgi:hypothetical protein
MNQRPLCRLMAAWLTACFALPSFSTAAEVSPGPNADTRAQYRACVDDEADLRARRSALYKNTVAHNAELKRLQAEIDALVATQDQVLADGGGAVQAFNTKLEALNTRARSINQRGEDYDRQQAEHNLRAKEINARCSGLSISFKDRDAVFTERAADKAAAQGTRKKIELNPTSKD